MTELVALLSTGKGTWSEVVKLISNNDWEKIYLITNDFGRDSFKKTDNIEFVVIDPSKGVDALIASIMSQLKGKIKGTEVALNMISGSGKEHMAALSSLLKLGLGIRLVVYDGAIKEI